MMWRLCFNILFIISYIIVREYTCGLITDEDEAREFLRIKDERAANACFAGEDWDMFSENMTTDAYAWKNFTDPLLRRAFQLSSELEEFFRFSEDDSMREADESDTELSITMSNIFNNYKICAYNDKEKENCKTLGRREMQEKFSNIGNEEERRYYWITWRNSISIMRNMYDERMQLKPKLKDLTKFWTRYSEDTSSINYEALERTWQEVLPLYKELHAYIRRRLTSVYGTITNNGPIPSHFLGLSSGNWWNVKDIALPFPSEEANVTEMIQKKNMTVIDLFKLAEDFYHSLGLPKIDNNIWNNSEFTENNDCGTTFNYACKREISKIKACLPLQEINLHRIMGYLMHVYIANHEDRTDWPWLIHGPTNFAIMLALRHAGELSSWSNDYLAQNGFEGNVVANNETLTMHDMNLLIKVALKFLMPLSYLYKVTKWTSESELTCNRNYNKKWWEYSLEYQGICPPIRRTEEEFDPASSHFVALSFPVISEFVGIIYGFQFYKAACKEAGHNDMLHRCNLYGEKTFGDKIKKLIYLGNSILAPEAIYMMTNNETDKMDVSPLLEYFQPMYEWLKTVNQNKTVGWYSSDPMVCPSI